MTDLAKLQKLISLLKKNGVSTYESKDIKLSFNVNLETSDKTQELPIDESKLPADLRTDNINNMDAILNWSSSDQKDEVPGTGDSPMSEIQ